MTNSQHINELMKNCRLCPRICGADRTKGYGFCLMPDKITAALASVHMYEEPPISGQNGSGTVFFSGCNLKCVFCQNHHISQEGFGTFLTEEQLAKIFINQQNKGVHNINIVSGAHFAPQIAEAIKMAKKNGLKIPVVYNSSGYELVSTLKILNGLVDVYLPDIKYFSPELSEKYSMAKDYFSVASKAVIEMYSQAGPPVFDDNGIMLKGVIIRHLVLPSCRKDSFKILDFIKEAFGDNVYVSILNQYTPMYKALHIKELNRRVTTFEYQSVIDHFFEIGLKNGYMQGKESAKSQYTPVFDLSGLK